MENISFDECLIDKGRETTDDFLAHHGILGMKWGVRKDGKPQGWQGGKGKKAAKAVGSGTKKVAKGTARAVSRGYGKARELNYRRIEKEQLKEAIKNDRKLENQRIASRDIALTTRSARTLSKHMNSLTDAELQQRINRLQKENQVREMAAAERERGRSWVSKSLEKSAKKSVENLTTYGITKAGKTAIDGFLDEVGKQSAKDSDKPSYSTTSTKSSSGNYTSTTLYSDGSSGKSSYKISPSSSSSRKASYRIPPSSSSSGKSSGKSSYTFAPSSSSRRSSYKITPSSNSSSKSSYSFTPSDNYKPNYTILPPDDDDKY